MTAKKSASRSLLLEPTAPAHGATKNYVDSRSQILVDEDGTPYYETGVASPTDTSMQWAGVELQAAIRAYQFNWSGTGWVDIEGLEIKLDTLTGPVSISATLGFLVADNGNANHSFYTRILNQTDGVEVAIALNTVPAGAAGSTNATGCLPLAGRLVAGTTEKRYVVQVQSQQATNAPYLAPSWLGSAVCLLEAVGR